MTPPRKLSLPDSAALDASVDARRCAPSASRNAEPILAELRRHAPERGRLLEIASGTGQHAAAFAATLPDLDWQPSDANPDALTSIRAWVAAAGLANLRDPVLLDATEDGWAGHFPPQDAVLLVNLLHLIAAPEAARVLAGIGAVLIPGGRALIYGPFKRNGALGSAGDRDFDAHLRAQDASIGYKDVAEVVNWANDAGLTLIAQTAMPANNLMLCFRRD
jgi:SAM-dependent methyltransferase